jgi:hypothetical protein
MFPKPLPGVRSHFEGRPKRLFLRPTLLSGILFLAAALVQTAKSVTLASAPSSGPNLAGYRVHEGTSSGTYTQTLEVGNRTTISNLTAGAIYHFVSAYDTAGVESAYSNKVVFTAPGVLPNFVPSRDLVWRNTASVQVPWRTVAAEWDSLSEQQRGGPEYLEEYFRRKRLDMERQLQFLQYRKDSHGAHLVAHSAKPAGQPLTGCERTG